MTLKLYLNTEKKIYFLYCKYDIQAIMIFKVSIIHSNSLLYVFTISSPIIFKIFFETKDTSLL